jgi:hypothetical protein
VRLLPLAAASREGWAVAAVTAAGRASLPVALRWRSAWAYDPSRPCCTTMKATALTGGRGQLLHVPGAPLYTGNMKPAIYF